MAGFVKYGMKWPAGTEPLQAEFWCIRKGKDWCESQGRSLFYHYQQAERLLWPTDQVHRWSDLSLRRFLEKEIVIMMGCGASNKTYRMARFALTDWWAYPDETLWLISSTEYRGADLRIWGDIQLLFNRAKKLHDWLPGVPLISLHSITNQSMDDDEDFFKAARSLKRGLIVVPNKKGNTSVGLGPFIGVRVPRLRHAGDEVQMMSAGFADAYSNWIGNSDFHGYMGGNPMDITDQLCSLAEPKDGGWDNFIDTEKTQEWTAKWFDAHVISFDGRDSPNNDFPDAENNPKFPYLVGPKKLKKLAETYGKDSWNWWSQGVGKPNKSGLTNRVVTKQICESHRALEEVIWLGERTTLIYALDPSYGGQDRCVGGRVEFGKEVDGQMVVAFYPPEIIPVKPVIRTFDKEPETQIALFIKARLEQLEIPPANCFYDACGKGTLGMAFAEEFGKIGPVALDSGAKASDRPVRFDLKVEENGKPRLKKCSEAYLNWVTEAWFSVGEAIRSKQVRQLPTDVMKELCLRYYLPATNNRVQIEPKSGSKTKQGFIERVGYSPDLGDWAAFAIEGCRQRGFQIKRLGDGVKSTVNDASKALWLRRHAELESLKKNRQLQSA